MAKTETAKPEVRQLNLVVKPAGELARNYVTPGQEFTRK